MAGDLTGHMTVNSPRDADATNLTASLPSKQLTFARPPSNAGRLTTGPC
jgi:hypothetical protein